MNHALNAILTTHLVAVIRLDDYDEAVAVARALLEGGISVIEFSLTGTGAYAAIAATRATLKENVSVGVGTVLHPDDVQRAIDAGAEFVVTPVLKPEVIATSKARGTTVICGALTPTEALAAHEAGADLVKIFPGRALGPQYIRDILAPLPMLRLVPTGGIGPDNLRSYLEAGAVAVGLGGELVRKQSVAQGDWASISAQARACVAAVSGRGTQ